MLRPVRLAGAWVVVAVLVLGGALFVAGPRPASSGGGVQAAWVELGPAGRTFARAVTTGPSCPDAVFDGRPQPMQPRGQRSDAFPVLVCEARVPIGAAGASVGGRPLPVPKADPRRILVVGDTGCRLKGSDIQACNDPRAWPFAAIAATAAAWQPDLIIHVGDYLYRESPCPSGDGGCAGSPWGDNWATWDADFFTPAGPLLTAAPWVFVRGDHELCERGGAGWFLLLDPWPWSADCTDYTEPYRVPAGRLDLLVLDSANASDFAAEPDQVAAYTPQFDRLRGMATQPAWLVTHRTMWAVGHLKEEDGQEQLYFDNPTLQAASRNDLGDAVRLVLSGHLHLFEMLAWDGRAPQMVAGTGGTLLDNRIRTPLAGLMVGGARVTRGSSFVRFGFVSFEPAGEGWAAVLWDPAGAPIASCDVQGGATACVP